MIETCESALMRMIVGDIFHAEGSNGASLICIATQVDESVISARTVTTQYELTFDRKTGIANWGSGSAEIDSIAPLPVDVHNIMLGLDRKFRLERSEEKFKLNDAEKRALTFVDTHYASNQLKPSSAT